MTSEIEVKNVGKYVTAEEVSICHGCGLLVVANQHILKDPIAGTSACPAEEPEGYS